MAQRSRRITLSLLPPLLVVIHSEPSGAATTARTRPKLVAEVPADAAGVRARQHHRVERLPGERADPGPAPGDGQPAGRAGARRRPGGERVGVAARSVAPLDLGPAVVAAPADAVELVGRRARRTPWPTCPRRRPRPAPARCGARRTRRGCRTGCPPAASRRGSAAGSCRPAVGVLRLVRVLAVAGAGEERPAGPEGQPAAVVARGPGDAGQQRSAGRAARRRRTASR